MPAPPLANSFEGGTDTVAITVANSGGASGDAFQAVADAGSLLTYDSAITRASGLLVAKATVAGVAQVSSTDWRALGNLTGDIFLRSYHYMTGVASINAVVQKFETAAPASCLQLFLLSGTSQLRAADSALGTLGTLTTLPSFNAWIRIEMMMNQGTGAWEVRLFNSPESSTPTDSISGSGASLGAGGVDRARFGCMTSAASYTWRWDDVGVSTAGWLGPSGPPPPPAFGPPAFNPGKRGYDQPRIGPF